MMKTAPLLSSFRSRLQGMIDGLSRDKADALLLLCACALVLVPHVNHLPGWISPVCVLLLGWRGWLTFRGTRMPPRWLLLPVALLAMVGVYGTYRTLLGRDAGVAMLALLLTLKLLEMHAKRDLFVVLFLSFFLILASFFYSQSIGTALLTIIAVLAILTTQLSFQYGAHIPPLKQRIKLSGMILLLAAPLTLVLFLLFPRIQGPLWGLPGDAHAGRTGLSDTMTPGNISKLALSNDVAFRVKFNDAVPAKSKLYWRGVVLGDYDGRTWSPLQIRKTAGRNIVVNLHGEPVRYQVTLEPHGRRWLFLLELPQALPQLNGQVSSVSADVQVLAFEPINSRVRYDAASHVEYELQPNESPLVLQQWLELPARFNPRTLEMAAQLSNQFNHPAALIDATLQYFREQPFRYTLEPPALGKHSIDDFLFTTRAGFCEHYASAFVVLMRAMGIPARVVTGYQGGEINPADGFMVVRQSDAHAWAEVWLAGRGWIRIDPTATVSPNRIEMNLHSVLPNRLLGGLITLDQNKHAWLQTLQVVRQNWDALSNAWNQWVLNYTPDKQKSFVQSLGFNEVDWRTLVALLFAVGSIVLAAIALPLLIQRKQIDPFEALYQTLCRQMERHGYPKAIHEGPRTYCARLTATDSTLSAEKKAAVIRFLTLYETVRYANAPTPSRSALSTLKSLLIRCR